METNNLKLFRQTLSVSNVNTVLFKKDGSNVELGDNRFRMRLYENYSYDQDLVCQKIKPGALVYVKDEFLHSYLFLRVPESYVTEDDTELMSLGPFLEKHMEDGDILEIMRDNHIPEHLLANISSFYDGLPVVENTDTLESLVLCLATGLFGQEYHIVRLPEYDTVFLGYNQAVQQFHEDPELALASIGERYEVENQLLDAISAGDYDHAHSVFQKFLTYRITPRAEDPVRNQQHIAIIFNTLFRKAVERSGVHPLYIDDLSTKFAVLINKTESMNALDSLTKEMVHKYCLLVKNYAMKGYASVTKEIISYIDFHYTEDLSLNFFADMFSLTRTYLSSLFKNDTGTTLTDHIHQVRMRKAISLINSTALPVTVIATTCGYNDINYFIRIFKRTYGLSPKQYRKSIIHP